MPLSKAPLNLTLRGVTVPHEPWTVKKPLKVPRTGDVRNIDVPILSRHALAERPRGIRSAVGRQGNNRPTDGQREGDQRRDRVRRRRAAASFVRKVFLVRRENGQEEEQTTGKQRRGYSDRAFFIRVRDYLSPGTTRFIDETAQACLELFSASNSRKSRSKNAAAAALVIVHIARQIPYNHESHVKLAQLVERLSMSLVFLTMCPDTGIVEGYIELREWVSQIPDDGPNSELPNAYANISAFCARLLQQYRLGYHLTTAIHALREAHEMSPQEIGSLKNFQGRDDQCVLAAAQYIFYCGTEIYMKLDHDGEDNGTTKNIWKPGSLYPGDHRLNLQRWEWWQKGFARIEMREGSSMETRRVAGRAAAMMAAIHAALDFSQLSSGPSLGSSTGPTGLPPATPPSSGPGTGSGSGTTKGGAGDTITPAGG